MNQRFQFLNFTAGAGKVTVQAPANANLAPPGDYMLFLVDTNGVPSVGSFIRYLGHGDATPPTAPTNLTGDRRRRAGRADLDGVDRQRRRRALQRPPRRRRRASPRRRRTGSRSRPGRRYIDAGLTAGTYYYKVTAEDAAGNRRAPRRTRRRVTVRRGPPPGLVAAYGFDEGSGTTTADQSGNGNTGTLSNATWSTPASSATRSPSTARTRTVTVPDSNSLDLTTGMTIEGWVNPRRRRLSGR